MLAFKAITAGAFWGAAVATIYRGIRRNLPNPDANALWWFAIVGLLTAAGVYLSGGRSH